MNNYEVNYIGKCNLCGGAIITTSGTPHFCNRGSGLRSYQLQPLGPLWPPLPDEKRIREIVREELERRLSEVSPSTEAPSEEK